jgi:hypothetical protein
MKKQGRFDEAKKKLQKRLFDIMFSFAANTCWLADCFRREGDKNTALALYELNAEFTERFTRNGKASYCDWMCASNFGDLAEEYKKAGLPEKMRRALETAAEHAVKFDEAPSYKMADVGFMDGAPGYISNSNSGQACDSLILSFEKNFSELSGDEKYEKMLSRLKTSRKSKAESGVWENREK